MSDIREWNKWQERQMEILREVAEGKWQPTMELPRDGWDTILYPDPPREMTDEERENYVGQLQIQQQRDLQEAGLAEMRAVNSAELVRLNDRAIHFGYNRALSAKAIADLHPDGVHIVRPFMVHRHAAGEPVKPHFRCFIYLRMNDTPLDKPAEATIDVDKMDFSRLTKVTHIARVDLQDGGHRHVRFDFNPAELMRKLNKAA